MEFKYTVDMILKNGNNKVHRVLDEEKLTKNFFLKFVVVLFVAFNLVLDFSLFVRF